MPSFQRLALLSVLIGGLIVGGCVLAPGGAREELARMQQSGKSYDAPRSQRRVPDVPDNPNWKDLLSRAFLSSGELEAAYHEWAMAVHRIDQRGTYPTQPLQLGYEYMFSSERMKTFDRQTLSASLMDATPLPNKIFQDATIAWREAQSAGEKFRQAKFELQSKVLGAWANYALQAEKIRIQEENVKLLSLVSSSADARVRAGAPQQDLLRAQVEVRTAQNELESMKAELKRQRTSLNAMLVRPADAPLNPPETQPAPRPVTSSDDQLLALGVQNNPELASLDKDDLARQAAIVRAEQEYQPEFNLSAALTGNVSQAVGGMIVIPTRLPAIRAMIQEARSDLRRVEAMRDQRRADRAAQFAATLIALRDAERRVDVYTREILPLANQSLELTRRGYSNGSSTYLDMIEAQRTLLDVRLMLADARAMRERMLADLEMLAGADIETMIQISTFPASTQPITPSTP